ncbi:ATP-binding protein [Schlesneria paludicola]|uniref:ATP-binding protein n=1 Tax=Schlesneria paludicola TaxID=360056 RepID=UPI00029B2547|nr:ATP-binding protein [Schlesneria paludicola]
MDQSPNAAENPTRRLDKRSWISLLLVAALIVLHQFLIQPALMGLTTDAPVINSAGRQRMLSQKLVKSALAMVSAADPFTRERARAELSTTLSLWRESHAQLQSRPPTLILGRHESDLIRQRFLNIEPHFQAMITAADALLIDDIDPSSQNALTTMMRHESDFLTGMHEIVELYEKEARQHVYQLQLWGLMIMAVILGVQLFMQMRVIRPQLSVVGDEWKKIDDRYRMLVESMTDGLVVFDSSGRIEFANRQFENLLGRETGALWGRDSADVVDANDQLPFERLFTGDGAPNGPTDLRWRTANGQIVETIISPRRLTNKHGRLERLLLVVTDMTARGAIDQRNQQLKSELAHADRLRSMGTMAAMIAHEINQSLCAIANYAEGCLGLLRLPTTGVQELKNPLQKIVQASQRGAEVIRRTRDYSRRTPDRVSVVSVEHLLCEVEELCRSEARRRSVVIELCVASDLPRIVVDAIQIQQVLTNLIQNAFDAFERANSPDRRIVLSARRIRESELEFAVADTGPGLPDGDSESWFQPFVTTNDDGTGLGLAISKGIVESHHGRIWAETPSDTAGPNALGTAFRFVLPLEDFPGGLSPRTTEEDHAAEAAHVR